MKAEHDYRSNRAIIGGVHFDLLDNRCAFDTIECWRKRQERHFVTLSNPHTVEMARRAPELRTALGQAGLTLPDGIGIAIAASLLGQSHNGRVTGPSLMLTLCDMGRSADWRHFFYGSTSTVLRKLDAHLRNLFPGLTIAGSYSPPFRACTAEEDKAIISLINNTRPDVVWVGLGAPKQELWMSDHVGHISAAALVGVGAAFDFHSGNMPWAPPLVRRVGLEWLWRLLLEPRRMFRKNLDNPRFLLRVLAQAIRHHYRVSRLR